jgi:hypothetical protein
MNNDSFDNRDGCTSKLCCLLWLATVASEGDSRLFLLAGGLIIVRVLLLRQRV